MLYYRVHNTENMTCGVKDTKRSGNYPASLQPDSLLVQRIRHKQMEKRSLASFYFARKALGIGQAVACYNNASRANDLLQEDTRRYRSCVPIAMAENALEFRVRFRSFFAYAR